MKKLVYFIFTITLLSLLGCQPNLPERPSDQNDVDPSLPAFKGLIISLPEGAQYDDYFQTIDGDVFGINGKTAETKAEILSYRDKEKLLLVRGELMENVPDYKGKQLLAEKITVILENSPTPDKSGKAEKPKQCNDKTLIAVYRCNGDSVKGVLEVPGAGFIIFKKSGEEVSCPVENVDNLPKECLIDCDTKNLCE